MHGGGQGGGGEGHYRGLHDAGVGVYAEPVKNVGQYSLFHQLLSGKKI